MTIFSQVKLSKIIMSDKKCDDCGGVRNSELTLKNGDLEDANKGEVKVTSDSGWFCLCNEHIVSQYLM